MLKYKLVLILCIVFTSYSYAKDIDTIKKIRTEYQNIEANISKYISIEENVDDFCKKNILVNETVHQQHNFMKTFYSNVADIKKIILNCENQEQKSVLSLYFNNNQLFFIYSLEKFSYGNDENRYYFDSQTMIKWINHQTDMNQKYEMANNHEKYLLSEEYHNIEQANLSYASYLKKKAFLSLEKK
ncbi:hypothetical protein [Sulfurimonas sp.]